MAQLDAIRDCMTKTRQLEGALTDLTDEDRIVKIKQLLLYNKMCYVSEDLVKVLAPIILIIGTIGNVLSFIVLCRRQMRNTSSYIYLAVLALVDQSLLIVGLLRVYIEYLTNDKLERKHNFFCKFGRFFGYTLSYVSVWLIVIMTVERALAITLPLKAWSLSMPSRCKKIIIIMTIMICVFHFHWFFTVSLYPSGYSNATLINASSFNQRCKQENFFLGNYWAMIDGALYSYLPFIIIAIANALIIVGIYKASNKRKLLMHTPDTNQRQQQSSRENCFSALSQKYRKAVSCCSNHRKSVEIDFDPNDVMLVNNKNRPKSANNSVFRYDSTKSSATRQTSSSLRQQSEFASNITSSMKEMKQITIMLLVISCLFLLLTGPIAITKFLQGTRITPTFIFLDTLAILSMYLNHSINFFLYCAMGNRFRSQLFKLFCPSKANAQRVILIQPKNQKVVRRECHSQSDMKCVQHPAHHIVHKTAANNVQMVPNMHNCSAYSNKSTPSSSATPHPYVINEAKTIRWKWQK